MIQRILLLTGILCLCLSSAKAQSFGSPTASNAEIRNTISLRTCAATQWNAGTSSQALGAAAQSNDVEYLCFQDRLDVTHDGNYNIDPTYDPVTATQAGVAYGFFSCPPTTFGPDISNIEGDPCIMDNPGYPTPPNLFNIVMTSGPDMGANGTGFIQNGGGVQRFFSATEDPTEVYFAPITIHDYADLQFEPASSGSDDYCVNMNFNDVFRVVFLNAIEQKNVSSSGCSGSFDIEGGLSQFDALKGSSSAYTINITKSDDASITGTVTSGAATHGGTVNFTVPEAGTYNVSVEDGKSCGASFQVDMSTCTTTTALTVTSQGEDVKCAGNNDGKIKVDIAGGTTPYDIQWQLQPSGALESQSTSDASYTINNLTPGTYSITVSDATSASEINSVTIKEPGALGAQLINLVQPSCNGASNGSISVQVLVGGVPITPDGTYKFQWSGTTQTTATVKDLASSGYEVTVTNGAGCTATASTTLSQPAPITTTITKQDAQCDNLANGEAEVVANGGNSGFSYTWSTTPTQNTAKATNLAAGKYFVTVSDDKNCTHVDSVTITNITSFTLDLTAKDLSCNGINDGSISVNQNVTGVDNGGYSYSWTDNVSTSDNATGLAPGTYTVTVTDKKGCLASKDTTINEPTVLTLSTTPTDETCTVGKDGSVTTTVSGGTPEVAGAAYNYTWSNGETSANITDLTGDTYTVTVTDANNCSLTSTAIVNTPTPPSITSFTAKDIQCFNTNDGQLIVNASPGNGAITAYQWSTGTSTTDTVSNLTAGTYTVTVTDDAGCVAIADTTLIAPLAIIESKVHSATTPLCPGSAEGTATVYIAGGSAPYNYFWSNGTSGPEFSTATNLSAGRYEVTVVDARGCSLVIDSIDVSDPPPIQVIYEDVKPVSCFNSTPCNGQATIIASGGLSTNYTFTWASGETSTGGRSTAYRLCKGNQSVTVTDGFCTVVLDMGKDSIPAPPAITIANLETTPVSCYGERNGVATITPTGGAGEPYNIIWSNGQGGPTATNLNPRIPYTVTITDAKGCQNVPFTISVGEPDSLVLEVSEAKDISCNSENNGSIQVAPKGGTAGDFQYSWSPNISNTTNIASELPPGGYNVTVTDARGCTASTSAIVREPDPLRFNFSQPAQPQCNGFSTVFALDTVYGGTGSNYTYTVDGFNFLSTSQAASVFAGTYEIKVIDSLGCSATEQVVVTEPNAITVDLGDEVSIELGDSIKLSATISPIGVWDSVVWSPANNLSCINCIDPVASPLDDITYQLTVFDENGCSATGEKRIDVDPNRNVFIPNIFTPNGDDRNDFFTPLIGRGVQNIDKFTIYDRWGAVIYDASNFTPNATGTNGWDGRFNNKEANTGVYIYIIEVSFIDGAVRKYKGDVTLIR